MSEEQKYVAVALEGGIFTAVPPCNEAEEPVYSPHDPLFVCVGGDDDHKLRMSMALSLVKISDTLSTLVEAVAEVAQALEGIEDKLPRAKEPY